MLIRSNLSDLFNTTALPAINHLVWQKYNEKPSLISTCFNMQTSDRDIEQTSTFSGFDVATTIAEGESVTYQDIIQGYDKTYTHVKYGKGFRVSDELIADGKFMTIEKLSKALGRSLFEVREVEAADEFNSGTTSSSANPNGEALFSTTHALIRGGTEQNTLTTDADLSMTSLRQALADLRDTRSDENLRLNIKAKYLLTPGTNPVMYDAYELTRSTDRPDTASRAINNNQLTGLEHVIWDYLTDADSWFLVADKGDHELYFFDREAPKLKSDVDFDPGAHKVKMETRFSHGWSDWRGLYGCYGA